MATSPDHPELRFIQAAGYTKGRPDGPPLWIVVHDMEAPEDATRAENTALYFASGSGGRNVSAHYCVDNTSVVQCVLLKDSAWTVGNRPGNNRGINWEFSGFARQTREQWLDPFGLAMFAQAAPIIRSDMARYGIPVRRCSVADLKAFRPGITSHNDLRLAFGGTTHTDPGPNFPWDVFLSTLEEDDVALSDKDAQALIWRVEAILNNRLAVAGGPTKGEINQVAAALEEVANKPPVQSAPVDPAALKAVLLDPEVMAAVAKAVNDDSARRMAE
jgi:hypothetical protein